MINPSEPVRLCEADSPVGMVVEIGGDGLLTVDLDGRTVRVRPNQLVQAEEDKSWPPAGMETKTPHLEVK